MATVTEEGVAPVMATVTEEGVAPVMATVTEEGVAPVVATGTVEAVAKSKRRIEARQRAAGAFAANLEGLVEGGFRLRGLSQRSDDLAKRPTFASLRVFFEEAPRLFQRITGVTS